MCAVVGIIIEWLDNMHVVTMEIKKNLESFLKDARIECAVSLLADLL